MDRHVMTQAERMCLHSAARDLHAEFRGIFGEETIELLLLESYDALASKASVTRWLVVGAERFTRQRLQALAHAESTARGNKPAVLFLCVHNAGRSLKVPARRLAGVLADHHVQVPEVGQRGAGGLLVAGSGGEVLLVGLDQAVSGLVGDLCEMNRDYCEHGLQDRRGAVMAAADELLISPNGMGHFPGCPHKGDDPDYSRWAKLDMPRAWERLGNGERLQATGGEQPKLIAASRCQDCESHGPW